MRYFSWGLRRSRLAIVLATGLLFVAPLPCSQTASASVVTPSAGYRDAYANVSASYGGGYFATIRVTTSSWVVTSNQKVTVIWTVTDPNGNTTEHTFNPCIRADTCNKSSDYELPVDAGEHPISGTYYVSGYGVSNIGQRSNTAETSFTYPIIAVPSPSPSSPRRLVLAA